MRRIILLLGFVSAVLAIVARYFHHFSLSAILIYAAVLAAVLGLILTRRDPVTNFLDDMRRHAD